MSARDLAREALDTAQHQGAAYADVRLAQYRIQSIRTREARVMSLADAESEGFGVRVLVDGVWGFASSNVLNKGEIQKVAAQAVEVAKANKILAREKVRLAPVPAYDDVWQTPFTKDPFRIPVARKIDLLLRINETAAKEGADFCSSGVQQVREDKTFASTEGSYIEQNLVRVGTDFTVTAVDKATGKFKNRSSYAQPMGRGWESIEEYQWFREAADAAREARMKLTAKPVEPGRRDIVVHPSQLWLTIHETIGHSTEYDRILGYEANFAGTSFVKSSDRGKLTFGSPLVTVVANKVEPGGLATCGYDDDGVRAKAWPLVQEGKLVDFQYTRDQAPLLGASESTGCCYADSYGSVPFQRMPNVSLQPGPRALSLEELIADTKSGLLFRGNGSWSIDHQRYNFQMGAQTVWEIRDGKIGDLVEDTVYQANTLDFWRSCDAVCDGRFYELGGAFNDGKGEPQQYNAVSHGCPPARFRNVNILNTGRADA